MTIFSRSQSKPGRWLGHLSVAVALALAQPVHAQTQTRGFGSGEQTHSLQWWHGIIAMSGLSVLMALDEPAQRYLQSQRTGGSNGVANTLRHFGQIEVYGPVTAGLLAVGLVSKDENVIRTGLRLASTLAFTGATVSLTKLALGRERPDYSRDSDSDEYLPFSGHEAMPSGHTAIAFALATTLADEIERPWASIGLYTLASGVAWSRLNDNRHWLSDVAAGAAVGITASKLVSGRWRIFNLQTPRILLSPQHAALAWQVPF